MARRLNSALQSLIVSHQSWVISLLIVLLTLLLFWRLWTPNPADRQVFAAGDFVEQFYPLRRFAADELKAGRLPLWNPYIYAGTPALADPQWATLYPLAWVSAFIPPWPPLPFEVLEAEAGLHIALAGIFTYLFARRHLPTPAAPLSAIVYAFGGYLTSYPPLQLAVLETATWLPLCLWGAEALTTEKMDLSPNPSPTKGGGSEASRGGGLGTARRVALATLPLTLVFLAGHPQTFMLIAYTSVAYYLACAHHYCLPWRTALLRLALWGVAAGGLTAGQWLPTVELARLGPRLVLPYAEAAVGFSWPDLAHILLPGAWGVWSPLYVGVGTLLLAGLAVVRGQGRFWIGLAVVGLLLSLGGQGGLYWLAYHLAPGFSLFRHQERAAVLWSFALAMLAGHGIRLMTEDLRLKADAVRRGAWPRLQSWVLRLPWAVGALAVALIAVWTWRGQDGAARLALWSSLAVYAAGIMGVAAWLIGRLYRHAERSEALGLDAKQPPAIRHAEWSEASGSIQPGKPDSSPATQSDNPTISRPTWALVALLALVGLDLFSTSGLGLLQTAPPGGYFAPNPIVWAIQADTDTPFRVSSEGLLPPGGGNGAVIWQLMDVVGNSPLHLAAHEDMLREVPELVWWRLLGVRYIVTKRDLQHGALAEVEQAGEARLYRLAGSLPTVWVVPALHQVGDAAQVRAALADPAFDPLAYAVSSDPTASALNLPTAGPPIPDAHTEVQRRSATALSVTIETPRPGLLVLSEAAAPGWRAWVNGQAAPVIAVDGLLQATPIPAGAAVVEWRYEPWTVRLGLTVSGLTLVALAWWGRRG